MEELEKAIEGIKNHTDLWPWYWLSYGEKCYAYAVVEAVQLNEDHELPRPGSMLDIDMEIDTENYVGENGTPMIIMSYITTIEQQNGGDICKFIAESHALLVINEKTRFIEGENGQVIAWD